MVEPVLPRVAVGDAAAIDECLSRYGGLVWSLARRSSPNMSDAEEAVQDVFVEVWRQAGRFDASVAAESTFVAMIARRKLIDRFRRRKSRPEIATPEQLAHEPADPPEQCPVELADEAARAREGLASLKPDERQFIQWSVCDGMSHAEVAERSGQPLGTVKSKIRRGLIRLREMVSPQPQAGGVA